MTKINETPSKKEDENLIQLICIKLGICLMLILSFDKPVVRIVFMGVLGWFTQLSV